MNGETAEALEDYVFSSNGLYSMYGIFADENMDSLAFFAVTKDGLTSFSLSRVGGECEAGRYLAAVFPGVFGETDGAPAD